MTAPHAGDRSTRIFPICFGAFLGLSLLKFGNPPIMEKWVQAPTEIYSFLLGSPWPIAWAYWLLILVGVVGVFTARRHRNTPVWLLALPGVWLGWEWLAGAMTVEPQLSSPTMRHFAACVGCFYLGAFALNRARDLRQFLLVLLVGFILVLAAGWEQHFGGLEQTRRYFFQYVYPGLKDPPPEYLKKISSNRIFSTLFYPNALAGALLLLLPAMLAAVWSLRGWFTAGARGFLLGGLGIGALACLYWSGSKGGWLLMLLLGLVALLRLPFQQRYKLVLLTLVLAGGLAGFFWKYSGFFQRGATSVSARFDYWRAALQTMRDHPVFGTGPGTFSIPYARLKRPEAEMARLAHNDYLQQGSDSGVPALILYALLISSALIWGLRKVGGDWLSIGVWLGLLGWALQELFEFGLYLPALAWPAFALFGWLLGQPGEMPLSKQEATRARARPMSPVSETPEA